MQTKRVNRYYCDFCKKSGCSAGHMKRHENRCTMNPNRVCGVCGMLKGTQRPIGELVVCLPDSLDYLVEYGEDFGSEGYTGELTTAANDSLPKLREVTNNCPACILAAIRQAKIPVPMVTDFDWTKEMEAAWADFNEANR